MESYSKIWGKGFMIENKFDYVNLILRLKVTLSYYISYFTYWFE